MTWCKSQKSDMYQPTKWHFNFMPSVMNLELHCTHFIDFNNYCFNTGFGCYCDVDFADNWNHHLAPPTDPATAESHSRWAIFYASCKPSRWHYLLLRLSTWLQCVWHLRMHNTKHGLDTRNMKWGGILSTSSATCNKPTIYCKVVCSIWVWG